MLDPNFDNVFVRGSGIGSVQKKSWLSAVSQSIRLSGFKVNNWMFNLENLNVYTKISEEKISKKKS